MKCCGDTQVDSSCDKFRFKIGLLISGEKKKMSTTRTQISFIHCETITGYKNLNINCTETFALISCVFVIRLGKYI